MITFRESACLTIALACTALLGGCGGEDDPTAASGDGQCTASIEFQGREYTAVHNSADESAPVEVEDRLGVAYLAPCTEGSDPDADQQPMKLVIFSLKGVSQSKAIYARPYVGLMEASEGADP